MSVPTRRPDSHGRRVPHGTADPPARDPAADTGPVPPPILDDQVWGGEGAAAAEAPEDDLRDALGPPRSPGPRLTGRGHRLAPAQEQPIPALTGEQRLLLLDAWRRSRLPAGDLAPLVGLSRHTLYDWKCRFEAEGPAGLQDKPRGSPRGSRFPEVTKRAILMMKQDNPDWGCERISALLMRGPALPAPAGPVVIDMQAVPSPAPATAPAGKPCPRGDKPGENPYCPVCHGAGVLPVGLT